MEYLFAGLALAFGLVVLGALGVSIFSFTKISEHMKLVARLLQQSSREMTLVSKSVEAVLIQTSSSMEQNRKASDHQRVLLASLNRQLIKLEEVYQDNGGSFTQPVSNAARIETIPHADYDPSYTEQVMAELQAAEMQQMNVTVVEERQVVKDRNAPQMQEQIMQAATQLAQRQHRPLQSLVDTGGSNSGTGARVPLAQHLRIQKQQQQRKQQPVEAAAPVSPQPVKKGPVIRTRETIDVLKMRERRVANG